MNETIPLSCLSFSRCFTRSRVVICTQRTCCTQHTCCTHLSLTHFRVAICTQHICCTHRPSLTWMWTPQAWRLCLERPPDMCLSCLLKERSCKPSQIWTPFTARCVRSGTLKNCNI